MKTDGGENDYYDEYLYVNGNFEFIGSTQIQLTGYVTTEEYNKLVNNEVQIVNTSSEYKLLMANANATSKGIAIGKNAKSGAWNGISLGHSAKTDAQSAINIGGANAFKDFSIAIGSASTSSAKGAIQLQSGNNLIPNSLQIRDDNIYNTDTHTLTVQNIELNGVDLGTQLGDLNTALETILGV